MNMKVNAMVQQVRFGSHLTLIKEKNNNNNLIEWSRLYLLKGQETSPKEDSNLCQQMSWMTINLRKIIFFWHSHPSKPLQEISTAYQYIETINKKTLSYKYLKDVHTCFKQFMRNNLILAVGRKSPSPINIIAKYHWFTRLWILKST